MCPYMNAGGNEKTDLYSLVVSVRSPAKSGDPPAPSSAVSVIVSSRMLVGAAILRAIRAFDRQRVTRITAYENIRRARARIPNRVLQIGILY